MKETTKTALRAAAVLGVAFGLCVTGLVAADAKSNPIKEAMSKYNKAPKGTDPISKKAGAGQATKEDHNRLQLKFPPAAGFADLVLVFEPKERVEVNRLDRDTRLFPHLSQSTLDIGLARVDMPLGQIPAVLMPHQQEPLDGIADDDQHPTGSDFGKRC